MPSVDIVIPNYQYARYLPGCVESILSQDVPGTRILIIDNASNDDSVEVAQEIVRRDARVDLRTRRKNLGSHASFNEGLDWAEADYFMVMCADDLSTPGALRRSIEIMEARPEIGLAYGRAYRLQDGEPLPDWSASDFIGTWDVQPGRAKLEQIFQTGFLRALCCSTLIRTAVHKRAGYYRTSLPHTDDFELWMRICCLADIASTEALHGVMRMHKQALSGFVYEDPLWDYRLYEDTFASFFSNEGAELADSRRLKRTANRNLAARAYCSAIANLCRGRPDDSRKLLGFALRRYPSMALLPPVDYVVQRDDLRSRVRTIFTEATNTVLRRRVGKTWAAEAGTRTRSS